MSARPPERTDAAEAVWAMQAFVESHARNGAIREALGLGLGTGRVKFSGCAWDQ